MNVKTTIKLPACLCLGEKEVTHINFLHLAESFLVSGWQEGTKRIDVAFKRTGANPERP